MSITKLNQERSLLYTATSCRKLQNDSFRILPRKKWGKHDCWRQQDGEILPRLLDWEIQMGRVLARLTGKWKHKKYPQEEGRKGGGSSWSQAQAKFHFPSEEFPVNPSLVLLGVFTSCRASVGSSLWWDGRPAEGPRCSLQTLGEGGKNRERIP